MNQNISFVESVIAFRKGSNAQGVRMDLKPNEIPAEIIAMIPQKKKATK